MAEDATSPEEQDGDDDEEPTRIPSVLETVKRVLEIAVLVARLIGM